MDVRAGHEQSSTVVFLGSSTARILTLVRSMPRSFDIFKKEQISDLLDVVAVVDAVMAKRMAEAPEFLDNVGQVGFLSGKRRQAAMASLSSASSSWSLPSNTRLACTQPPDLLEDRHQDKIFLVNREVRDQVVANAVEPLLLFSR